MTISGRIYIAQCLQGWTRLNTALINGYCTWDNAMAELDFDGLDTSLTVTPKLEPGDTIASTCQVCGRHNINPHCPRCNEHHASDAICKAVLSEDQTTQAHHPQETRSLLTASEYNAHLAQINLNLDTFVDKDGKADLTIIEAHLSLLQRQIELIRLEQMETHKRRNKVLSLRDSEYVDKLRSQPTSADIRAAKSEKRLLNIYEKAVLSWRRMNFKPKQIVQLMKDTYKKDVSESWVEGITP
jgi:hypothetical protein